MGFVWRATCECLEVESGIGCVDSLLILISSREILSCISSDESALPGAARQPLIFLVSPRKISKRRRPQCIAPSGCLMLCRCNREGRTTRFAQTSVPLFPIATTHYQQCISGKDKTARFALRCLRSMVALRALVNC